MKVAIVGAGIAGLCTARSLANRGHDVEVYEQFPLFHDRGSSHGRTRIVRRAYTDPFWTEVMADAYPRWAELEADAGQRLVDECGLLYFGPEDAPRVVSMVEGLKSLGVPHSVLTPGECADVLPGLVLQPDEVGVFTPEAGFVRADLALEAIHGLARAKGVQFHQQAADPHELAQRFDAVIVTVGAWIGKHIPLDTVVTRQTFAYEASDLSGPVWIDDVTFAYGFPSDELGAKVGAHEPGPETDPAELGQVSAEQVGQIESTLRQRFGIETPHLRNITTCLYTSTPDEKFRIGWLGSNVLYASACSGHGFKLGPWLGNTLANVIEGSSIPEGFRGPDSGGIATRV